MNNFSVSISMSQSSLASAHFKEWRVASLRSSNDLARVMMKFPWSPCVWKEGYRRQNNFLSCDWCVLDFDSPDMTLAEAQKTFCDVVHVIGTTKSHQVSKGNVVCDRFRVALKFEKCITTLAEYRWNMTQVFKKYPVDQSCKDGARFFWPCKQIISLSEDGFFQDVENAPTQNNFAGPKRKGPTYGSVLSPWTVMALTEVVPVGSRNTTWYRVAKDFARFDFSHGEIVDRIVRSATYCGSVSQEILTEIKKCTGNGIKKVIREEAYE